MKNFLPDYNLSDEQLKDYIQKYFSNHDIYFADFPENIFSNFNTYRKYIFKREISSRILYRKINRISTHNKRENNT